MKYHIKKPTPQKPSETASAQAALPMSVFISYAHAQSAVVQDIMAGLRARGHKVWFDAKDIAHGDDWRREITDGLLKSNGVLSFLSREAIRENGVCLDELGIAVGVKYGNIRTVLLQKEKDLQPIPSQLTHRQWLDMSDWQEKKAQGEESYQQWLQGKLALIVEMIESAESREFAGGDRDHPQKAAYRRHRHIPAGLVSDPALRGPRVADGKAGKMAGRSPGRAPVRRLRRSRHGQERLCRPVCLPQSPGGGVPVL